MWRRIRTVMMCLLMAALPVQSWAAATMVHCGPSHHRMAAATVDEAVGGHHGHAHDADAASGHDHSSHHPGMAPDAHADEGQADTEQPPLSLGKFNCSACATCCLGMALPTSVLTFEASVSSDTVQPGLPQGHAVFLTAGPERPPRPLLA